MSKIKRMRVFYAIIGLAVLFTSISCASDSQGQGKDSIEKQATATSKENSAPKVQAENTIQKRTIAKNKTNPNDPECQDVHAQGQVASRPTPSDVTLQKDANGLVNACRFVSKADLSKIMGVPLTAINVKDGTSSTSKHSRACFFRWEQEGIPNSGVLLQVQINPIPDEFDGWATSFVASKKTSGENAYTSGGGVIKYKDFPGSWDDGAYSFEMGKFFFRLDNTYVCMIAFNLMESTEKEQYAWAQEIGHIMHGKLR